MLISIISNECFLSNLLDYVYNFIFLCNFKFNCVFCNFDDGFILIIMIIFLFLLKFLYVKI